MLHRLILGTLLILISSVISDLIVEDDLFEADLQELDTVSNQAPTPHSKPKVDFIFKLLTMLIQSLEPPQNEENGAGGGLKTNLPVQVLFPQIYPIIKRVAEKWFQDADVIECMCNLLNQCVQTLQVQQNLVAPKWQLLAA